MIGKWYNWLATVEKKMIDSCNKKHELNYYVTDSVWMCSFQGKFKYKMYCFLISTSN